MCGILGVRKSWLSDRLAAERALDAMAWRGPDGRRLIESGDWFLGVARLAITDPGSDQPIRCPQTGRIALLNGAITSAETEWGAYGAQARTRNDAELLLLRMRHEGAESLTAMTGPYAFCVLDPARDEIWLGRDPEGEKPLFIVRDGGRVVAFSSCVASLRALGLSADLDQTERARFLRFGFCLGANLGGNLTLDSDFRGLEASVGDAARREETRRWKSQCSDELGARVVEAVSRCAVAEVPVGFCLSGGIDSSCIAASLARGGVSLPAYQFCPKEESTRERQTAAVVALATGHELRHVDGGPEILRALPDLTHWAGLPQGDVSVLALHALAKRAAADGIRVLLSGEGSDDIQLGYRRHVAAAMMPARGIRGLPGPTLSTSRWARAVRALGSKRPYDALLEVSPPGFRRTALAPEFVDGELPDRGQQRTCLARARLVDRELYLRHDLLPKLDTATMAAGIEGRCPFLDPGVLSCTEVNDENPRNVLGKKALRRAFAAHLPPVVLRQRKKGFSVPIDRWLRDDEFLPDLLTDRRTLERPHIDPHGLADMLDRHMRGDHDLGHALYLIAALELYDRDREAA